MDLYGTSAVIFGIIFAFGLVLFSYKIHFWKYARRPQKLLPDAPQDKHYAVLIPAKDESKVIGELLDSIKSQEFNTSMLDAYVIVTDKKDPTIKICKKYANTTACVLPYKVKSKGETLKYIINELGKQNKHYDGYFILDADNVLLPDFMKHMHNALCAGNDVVLGCRLSKKPSGHWVSAGSTLTWTFLNVLNNKCRSENGKNILVQGSPLLISKTIIEDFFHNDWPLETLTEDLELGYLCSINDFKTFYYEYALAYDEQPDTVAGGFNQRLRWLRGHHVTNRMYRHKFRHNHCKYNDGIYKYDTLYSLLAPIVLIVDCVVFAIYSAIMAIVLSLQGNPLWYWCMIGSICVGIGFYLILCGWTLFALIVDREKLNMTAMQ